MMAEYIAVYNATCHEMLINLIGGLKFVNSILRSLKIYFDNFVIISFHG